MVSLASPLSSISDTSHPVYTTAEELAKLSGQYKKSVTIVHVNIRSLIKNLDSLHSFIKSLNTQPDIIAISETRLNKKSNINLV